MVEWEECRWKQEMGVIHHVGCVITRFRVSVAVLLMDQHRSIYCKATLGNNIVREIYTYHFQLVTLLFLNKPISLPT